MSFMFGGDGTGGRRDRLRAEFSEQRYRAEAHLARDIGDEKAVSMDARLRPRRARFWPLAVVSLAMLAGAFGLLPRIGGFEITRDCNRPSFVLDSYDVSPGAPVAVKATGPNAGDYVLVSGDGVVSTDGDTVRVADGRVLTPLFRMNDCEASSGFVAPEGRGNHTIRLLHRSGGDFAEVSSLALTVKR